MQLEGFVIFYSCAVLAAPSNCDRAGPGVGLGVGLQAFWQISLQLLTWLAFALLPFSSQCGEVTLLGRQARHAQLEERKRRVAEKRRERAEKARAKASKASKTSKAKAQPPRPAQLRPEAVTTSADGVATTDPSAAGSPAPGAAAEGERSGASGAVKSSASAVAYMPLEEEDDEEAADREAADREPETWEEPRDAPAGGEVDDTRACVQHDEEKGMETGLAAEEAPAGTSKAPLAVALKPSVVAAADVTPKGASGTSAAGPPAAAASSSCAYQIGRAIARAFGFQARDNFATNRLLYLLSWDVLAFGGCAAVFALLLLPLAQQTASLQPGANTTLPSVFLSSAFWGSWRVEITFFLVRLVYALSALPFMIFHLPGVRTLLSHTFATGYTKRGTCVAADAGGLSAFVEWMDRMLQRPAAAGLLSAGERAKIERALAEARECLTAADGSELERPPPTLVTQRRRADLIAALEVIVPPTHPLFPQLFPERQICLEYAERMRAEAARKRDGAVKAAKSTDKAAFKSWEEHQSTKYGVEWQRDSEANACTLCESAFHPLLRRRHHCRLCGRLVCDACSKTRRVPRGGAKPERACDRCAQDEEDAMEE